MPVTGQNFYVIVQLQNLPYYRLRHLATENPHFEIDCFT